MLKVFLLYCRTVLNKDTYRKLPAGPDPHRHSRFNVSRSNLTPSWYHHRQLIKKVIGSSTFISTASIVNVMIPSSSLSSGQGHYLTDFTCYHSIAWVITKPTAIIFKPTATEIQNQKQILNKMWRWISLRCLKSWGLDYGSAPPQPVFCWAFEQLWSIDRGVCGKQQKLGLSGPEGVCDCSMKRERDWSGTPVWGLEAE